MITSLDRRFVPPPALRRLRIVLIMFMGGLVLSGLTAFPLQSELNWLTSAFGWDHGFESGQSSSLGRWILTIRDGLVQSYGNYPWLGYGTDWLAFSHIIIAIFFVGALVDPVRNIWVLQAGLIACALVPALALICGPIRHVPLGWRLIDCSFGVLGAIPLWYCFRLAKVLEAKSMMVPASKF